MYTNIFNIYIDQLKDGRIEKIQETLSPDFLEVNEKDLEFPEPIILSGEAYLANDQLVLRLSASTKVNLPCVICQEPVSLPINVEDFYHAVSLAEIKTAVYSFRDVLRETILLEVPGFAECNEGHCPERENIEQFFKKPDSSKKDQSEEEGTYRPFADL